MKLKKITKIAGWVITFIILIIGGLTLFSSFSNSFKYKIFVVESGSMTPTIRPGSLAVVKASSDYKKDDIITYKKREDINIKERGSTITHRIVKVEENGFVTKGDANDVEDKESVEKDLIVGKLILAIPYLGYPIAWAKTQTGLIFLIVIPATIIIYSEILNIKKEIVKIFKKGKKEKS